MKTTNKAFTLVELLAVIVILGIIAFLIFPSVSKTIEESREKAYARQISILEEAAQKYTKENIDKLSSDKRCVSIDTLISSGYIAAKDKYNNKYVVLNPKTDEPLSGGVQVKYDDTYNQYEYTYNSNCNKKITVTLDANGGTLGSSSSTKDVEYYNDYGELPTPTKTGYKFLGWNGRNLYNINDINRITDGVDVSNNDYITINNSSGVQYYNFWTHNLNVLTDTTYMVILETKEVVNFNGKLFLTSTQNTSAGTNWQFYGKSINSTELFSNLIYVYKIKTMETVSGNLGLRTYFENRKDSNGQYYTNTKLTFRISVLDVDNTITADNFDYEPYFITPSTVVVQENNHTLTAIWEAE